MENKKCPNCHFPLEEWTKYKDDIMKLNKAYALSHQLVNSIWQESCGGLISLFHKHDLCTMDLYYCKNCKRYYLKCPNCKNVIYIKKMPIETISVIKCDKCNKKIIYSAGDNAYS